MNKLAATTLLRTTRARSKSQIVPAISGLRVRNRFTHSLQVVDAATTLAHRIGARPDETAEIEALALLHDVGHPPFGHVGERVLDRLARADGGFESNAHTVHLLLDNDASPDFARRAVKYFDVIPPAEPSRPAPRKGIYHDDSRRLPAGWSGSRTASFASAVVDVADTLSNAALDVPDVVVAAGLRPVQEWTARHLAPDATPYPADDARAAVLDATSEAGLRAALDGLLDRWLTRTAAASAPGTVHVPDVVRAGAQSLTRIARGLFIASALNVRFDQAIARTLELAWAALRRGTRPAPPAACRCPRSRTAHHLQPLSETEVIALAGTRDVFRDLFPERTPWTLGPALVPEIPVPANSVPATQGEPR